MTDLDRENATYFREKPRLLAENKTGKFVLVHDDKIDSVWCCQADAFLVGYDKFWPKPFMVRQIQEKEPIFII